MPRRRFKSWSVELPDFWSEEGPITDNQAQFVGPKGVRLRLIVTWARPPQPVETTLHKPVGAHQRQLIETMPGVELSPPEARVEGGLASARRTYRVPASSDRGAIHGAAKYFLTTGPIDVEGVGNVVVVGQVVAESPDAVAIRDLEAIVEAVRIHDGSDAASAHVFYPYWLSEHAAKRRDAMLAERGRPPEGLGRLPCAANGLRLTVAEELPSQIRAYFDDDLDAEQIDFDKATREAWAAAGVVFDSGEIPVKVVETTPFAIPAKWREGMHAVHKDLEKVPLVVVGPHWLAASTAWCGSLHRVAAAHLGTDDLMVALPHRDRIFVFANRGETGNRVLAEGIFNGEHDAVTVLSPEPLRLGPKGVELFAAPKPKPASSEGGLQRFFFSLRAGMTADEIRAAFPQVAWEPGANGLTGMLEGIAPFRRVTMDLRDGGLFAARLQTGRRGDYSVMQALDAAFQAGLPDLTLMAGSQPWSIDAVRKIIEDRGNERIKMGTPVSAEVAGRGTLFGKAVGFKVSGEQGYGFELSWRPA